MPVNPQVEEVDLSKERNMSGIDYYTVTLDNIRGTHVRGQLARPTKEGKYPAMLVVQPAGVYALAHDWVIGPAYEGWLTLNISAHDLPINETRDFYANLEKTTLNNYMAIGCEDRETSYFLHMFLGDVRAVEYLTSRPDWDGKTLVVMGGSQGGLQSFVTAALCPQVTALMAEVPAGCDVYAPMATPPRADPWPWWLPPETWTGPSILKGHDAKKVQATAGYFDGINFAARVHCPALVSVGLIDNCAWPTAGLAAYNQLKGPKQVVIMPLSQHCGNGTTQGEQYAQEAAWRKALVAGQPPPIPK